MTTQFRRGHAPALLFALCTLLITLCTPSAHAQGTVTIRRAATVPVSCDPRGITSSAIIWKTSTTTDTCSSAKGLCTCTATDTWTYSTNVPSSGLAAKRMVYTNAGAALAATAAPTNGQLLIGDTGNVPALGTIAGTANEVSVTNAAHAITLSIASIFQHAAGANFLLTDSSDATKKAAFDLSGITTGTTRTLAVPDFNISLMGGPASATDNAVMVFDGITGKLAKNSQVTISDDGQIGQAVTLTTADAYLEYYGINLSPTVNRTSDGDLVFFGLRANPIATGTHNNSSGVVGGKFEPWQQSTGTLAALDGIEVNPSVLANSAVEQVVGVNSAPYVQTGTLHYLTDFYSHPYAVAPAVIAVRSGTWVASIAGSATITNQYGHYVANLTGATNNYAFWYDSPGVFRVKGDGVMAYYNPSFTKYTPGATDFERIVQQWNSNVAEYGPEVGGTGTPRALRLLGTGLNIASATITPGGTTGTQTINKTTGTVNFAAAAASLVVTNSLVTTSSLIFGTVRTNDSTCALKNIVPGSGSFTINMTAGCNAETSVGFLVINQ